MCDERLKKEDFGYAFLHTQKEQMMSIKYPMVYEDLESRKLVRDTSAEELCAPSALSSVRKLIESSKHFGKMEFEGPRRYSREESMCYFEMNTPEGSPREYGIQTVYIRFDVKSGDVWFVSFLPFGSDIHYEGSKFTRNFDSNLNKFIDELDEFYENHITHYRGYMQELKKLK